MFFPNTWWRMPRSSSTGADPEVVCFADPVTVALNHVHHADVDPGDTVLVTGQGFLGLLVTQLLRQQHTNVIATENEPLEAPARGEVWRGGPSTPGSRTGKTGSALWPRKSAAVIDCSGSNSALQGGTRLLARGGHPRDDGRLPDDGEPKLYPAPDQGSDGQGAHERRETAKTTGRQRPRSCSETKSK